MMHTTIPPAADGPALDLAALANNGITACEYIRALSEAVQMTIDETEGMAKLIAPDQIDRLRHSLNLAASLLHLLGDQASVASGLFQRLEVTAQ